MHFGAETIKTKFQLIYLLTLGIIYWLYHVYFLVTAGSDKEAVIHWLDSNWIITPFQAFSIMFFLGLVMNIFELVSYFKSKVKNNYFMILQLILLLSWIVILGVHFKLWQLFNILGVN